MPRRYSDFENKWKRAELTEVLILAGYDHRHYKGKGWGDGNNATNGPPKAGPWIGNLKVSKSNRTKAPGNAKPNGKYWIPS